ncbi:FAD-dependent oxidoreductase [Rhizobium sp. TRM96647]|uniref:NAD(P)/FAD-dependent oxidoreductase n=1 Tax=unclassified Rhizobium TaxID=2613769 RepID=UPI0021E82520|nr:MULTISPECIES: FAD-dependent oxidoreductase [unclassified Rhizobium]MCV3736810.1 FAD-dependent oxidoreductase [Rhizobium sp. TRM96647]MCV3756790.1 FAD-dependent oxidoreductase [Rhizobium sp. TRM96650]
MTRRFEFIVVGKGMMGAAAARHLASAGASVALIGPDEPADRMRHDGVFASHYDEGRITRTIDSDADWALLARRSIARYRALEAESGIPFYTEAGCLISGPAPRGEGGYLDAVVAARDRLQVDAPLLDRAQVEARFPRFAIPATSAGVFEADGAGYVNPRGLVAAETVCTEKAGGTVIRREVVSVEAIDKGAAVTLRSGETVVGGRVLVAAGGFSIGEGLLPRAVDLTVKARTVVFAEIAEADLAAFAGMPSWIDESFLPHEHFYLLPPIRYPDGKCYIKIGGDPADIVLPDAAAVRAWFRTEGNPAAAAHLRRVLARAMPDLAPVSFSSAPCVTTFTAHGYPYAGFADGERIALLAGGCGAAAKSCDEIGRIGADLLVRGHVDEPDYATDFSVRFRRAPT